MASGELSPEDAATMLDDRERDARSEAAAPPEPVTVDGVRRVRISGRATRVTVTGDPAVATAAVEGPHTMSEQGDELVIDCGLSLSPTWSDEPEHQFALAGARLRRPVLAGIPGLDAPLGVRVRVNPALPLSVDVVAGSTLVEHVDAPIECDVSAGSLRLRHVRGPLVGTVAAGSLVADAELTEGESKLSCEMGSLLVRLAPESDVRVRASANLGRAHVRAGERVGEGEWTMGSGTALLTVSASLGSVTVLEA
ncbi:MAG: hypothetical protein ACRD0G_11715 [Acidimicrobiales bacterium]